MKDENSNTIDVTRGGNDEAGGEGLAGLSRFRTIKSFRKDLTGFAKPPQTLWDQNFVGEVVSEADDCHPDNSSFAIGAVGGFAVGVGTGFFSTSRVPMPVKTIIPGPFFPRLQVLMRNSIIGSSVLWRVTKRTLLGTILFVVLECDFKDLVRKPSDKWQGSIAAGAVSGGIFGLRGGLPGMLLGAAVFAALPTGWELYLRKDQIL